MRRGLGLVGSASTDVSGFSFSFPPSFHCRRGDGSNLAEFFYCNSPLSFRGRFGVLCEEEMIDMNVVAIFGRSDHVLCWSNCVATTFGSKLFYCHLNSSYLSQVF
jgi:hypothetical protein